LWQIDKAEIEFAKGKADLVIVFFKGEYHAFVNPITDYKPLRELANALVKKGSRSLKDFAGISIITSLGLLSGYFAGANGTSISVTDDKGRLFGDFMDSNLDHTTIEGSTIIGSKLTLTSVERSYLKNVRGVGTTIAGSVITNSNVSAKMIYDSIVQNTLAVCSTITNSVIDLCRILNSTLVSVVDLVGSYIEDSFASNSANISNCTVMGSNLMSVVNLVNTSTSGSNLTLVVNVDNTKIDRSDISYSANISRSEITDTKLVGCTVQGSRLTSCTAVDSNLVNINATNSRLTKANVENSVLKGVELRNTNVFGTDLANVVLVDKTVMYGRSVDAGETGALRNLTASKIGTPNYSGKGTSSSAGKTTSPKKTVTTTSQPIEKPVSSQQVQKAIETAPSGVMPAEARRLLR